MKRSLILLCIAWICLYARAEEWNVPIIFPTPAVCEVGEGSFVITPSVKVKSEGKYAGKWKKEIQNYLKKYTGSEGKERKLIRFVLNPAMNLEKDAYLLEVTPREVTLTASAEPGLFYAKETLIQMMRYGKGILPVCHIQDQPRLQWRGLMLDESRHFFGKEKVFQLLDQMAALKMNVFHWHLTDEPGWRIEIKQYPKLTTIGAEGNWSDSKAEPRFYTQKEIKEVVRYAAKRHIMVVPEIDMPGHAIAACKAYPEVSGGGEGRWKGFTYHPCKEETYEFLSNILDEVVKLFPSPYIHIGGDEVHYGNQSWYTDPVIQAFIKDNNLGNEVGLEHYFLRRMADVVHAKGKTLIGWDEMVDAGISPDKAVVMWWRHDKVSQLKKAFDRGYRVIMTPRRPLYFDFVQHESHKIGRRWNGFNPVEDICSFPDTLQALLAGKESQLMGLQMSVWTERIADAKRLDFMIYPRIAAVAEAAWTPLEVKKPALFMKKLPSYLQYLESIGVYFFDPFNPGRHSEPWGPEKADVLQNG